jgi:MFS family permease
MGSAANAQPGRVTGFLLRNALANAGGMVAFLPLLSLLLPIKVEAIAGDARMNVLTAAVLAGALAASGSNLLFGWLSDLAVDRGIGRRPGVAFGLALTALAYALVALATTPLAIVLSIAFFQFAVNALLGPMFAIMADEIPDSHKRTAGGLLALGPPFGAAVSTLIMAWPLSEGSRLAIVTLAVIVCISPLLASRAVPAADAPKSAAVAQVLRRDLVIAWSARFLAQVAGAILSVYLVYYFESVSPPAARGRVAAMVAPLLLLSHLLPVVIAVPVGRWSDRIGRGKPFLLAAASVAALGLVCMALAQSWTQAAIAFATYSCGWSIFLALHAGFAMQLLPNPRRRGRDLGLLNLTNTLPQLVGPALTWWLATPHDFDAALLTAAALTACGALLILTVRGRR